MSESNKKRVTKIEIEYNWESTFPTILRALIKETDTKQDDLATFAGVSRQSIAQWKDGKTKPDIYYLGKIADFFKVSTDYLLGRTEYKTTDTNLQAVCEFTGLSERAVDSLILIKSCEVTDEKFLQSINKLLELSINNIESQMLDDFYNYPNLKSADILYLLYKYCLVEPNNQLQNFYISLSGKIMTSGSTDLKYTSGVTYKDCVSERDINTNDIIEQILINDIIEALKIFKKTF